MQKYFVLLSSDLIYQIALSNVPQIGTVQARTLGLYFENAASIFKAPIGQLKKIEGIGELRATNIKHFNAFKQAEIEAQFIQKNNIQPLYITDAAYPQRLLHCPDAPVLLYYKGKASLNGSKFIALVGTRSHTEYGKVCTENLIKTIASYQPTIVSGLAFGIDGLAHRCSMALGLATIGVLGHGLKTIYPAQHKEMAQQMLSQGGLLTELPADTKPDKHRFPQRNRIVAGLCDATIVIETGIKGGSIITAELANYYNRDVFALPGRVNDPKSAGCNELIKNNKAAILTGGEQLAQWLGWDRPTITSKPNIELFVELTADEQRIVDLLKQKKQCHIDELFLETNLSNSSVVAALLNLEFQGIINALPGKMYILN